MSADAESDPSTNTPVKKALGVSNYRAKGYDGAWYNGCMGCDCVPEYYCTHAPAEKPKKSGTATNVDGEPMAEGADSNGDASAAENRVAGLIGAMRQGSNDNLDDTTGEDDIVACSTGRHPKNRAQFARVESDSKGTHRGGQKTETDLKKRCNENWVVARTDGMENLGPQYFAEADGFPVAGQPAISVHLLQELKR
eukprot:COSAG03_NODE_1716_length_3607_cov_2.382269_5_plen_195_part_01